MLSLYYTFMLFLSIFYRTKKKFKHYFHQFLAFKCESGINSIDHVSFIAKLQNSLKNKVKILQLFLHRFSVFFFRNNRLVGSLIRNLSQRNNNIFHRMIKE